MQANHLMGNNERPGTDEQPATGGQRARDEQPCSIKKGWRFYGTLSTLALLNFICAVDATILAVALPTIATDLKGTTAIQAFWVGTSFLLCSAVFQPSWASFSHVIGRKAIILTALLLFSVGTVICSVADKVLLLLVGRCVQGVGGGGLVSLTYVVVSDLVTLRDRAKTQAIIISVPWAIGSVMAPPVGGAFALNTTWRWIFWFNIPFCVIAAIGIPICFRLHAKEGSIWAKLREFDWIGSFIFVAATTSFLIPMTWGGVMYKWSSWHTLVPLIVGVAGLTGFILYSTYASHLPLIRRSLFNSPTAIVAYFGTVVQGLIVWSLLYYMPIYFEVAKNFNPIRAGCAIMPFTFTVAPAAAVVGLVIKRTGRYRPSIWIGWFLTVLGMAHLIYLTKDTSNPSWIIISLIPGVGLGMLFSALGFSAQASVSNADLPFAGAMYSFFRAFGQTLGVAISGVIFQNTFKQKILATAYKAYADLWSRDASALVQIVKAWSDTGADAEMKQVVIQAYVESLKMVWIVMTALAGAAFVASLIWTAEISLERDLETEQGFRYERDEKKRNVSDDEVVNGSMESSRATSSDGRESSRTASRDGSETIGMRRVFLV